MVQEAESAHSDLVCKRKDKITGGVDRQIDRKNSLRNQKNTIEIGSDF